MPFSKFLSTQCTETFARNSSKILNRSLKVDILKTICGGGSFHQLLLPTERSGWKKNPSHSREVYYFLFSLSETPPPPPIVTILTNTFLSPLQLHHLQSLKKNTCTSSILYKSMIQNKAFRRVEYSC